MWVDRAKTMLPSTNTPSKRKQKQSQLIRPGIGWSKSCAMGDSLRPFSIYREICYLVITSPRKEDELLIKKKRKHAPLPQVVHPPSPPPPPASPQAKGTHLYKSSTPPPPPPPAWRGLGGGGGRRDSSQGNTPLQDTHENQTLERKYFIR